MPDPLIELATDLAPADGSTPLGLGDAVLLRRSHPSAIEGTLYRPLLCLILQGAKSVGAGALCVHCPAGHAVLVSHDLPVLSRITEASPDIPYLALVLPIDLALLRGFYDRMPDFDDGPAPPGALMGHPADPDLRGALHRLLAMVRDGAALPLLGPILLEEVHARLLVSPQGAILRRFLKRDDPSNHLTRAIRSIRGAIDRPLSVGALAAQAGMSKSSFHAHFKAVTGLSPGRYQKDIRLLEARRLILETEAPMSAVAFDVGYESPAQFSRDYARKFGRPPREDRKGERDSRAPEPAGA
ncbi:AraC family transcriptional regulator [Ovoidimarina sediminis]|uniref:AraC family transcriptional regulator n=1 Tax=Ovoidimarina sediminis TaxID=3079856 RepID=UPI00290C648C|nr:AraC family transcriptional regulator [Rhodophyticola sp. MJ-SS7]MDU8943618.1 AraC family transcriptional regulator [Rhodophyticola sp. MJ-SS7]